MRDLPSVSVIVPTRERPQALGRCLAALAALRYPRDRFEVVVVDDGSAEPPERMVASWGSRLAVRLLLQLRAGPGAARNRGAAVAQGEVLAFTDDDCAPEPDWLLRFAEALAENLATGVGGRTVNALTENRYAVASQFLIDYLYQHFNKGLGRVPLYTSNNLALPRNYFLALGGFDERYPLAGGEDRDLCARWVRAGHRLEYAADAIVRHYHDLDLRSFVHQHFRYGHGAARFHRVHSPDGSAWPRREPGFYRGLLAYLFARRSRGRAGTAGLLVLSQVANVAGFLHALVSHDRP